MAAHQARHKSRKVDHPRRGDIYLVHLDPTVGHEIKKTRPGLVIQNDIANRYSPITIVAAITSRFDELPYATEVVIEPDESGLPQPSAVLLNHIRSIDRQRLVKRLGRAGPQTMERVDHAIRISLGLVRI
jgi:mRNA interferase MazF